ncbi:hypothetical protein F511_16815 [Dorcoceras hygrometricum]|uniref:Uncharacterized protein n=1 Tax=Dorcoceras hygrometricum TaxID=472368 RepID=A0A2Z7CW79_9LAMI|nr:hypothetical protein F511_16815 [Dorcoceras hygrometricum]
MQYIYRAMHERSYQESSVANQNSTTTQLCKSHQSSSSCDLQVRRLSRPSQGSVVFRHNDSADHHIKTTLDLSGTTTQLVDHNMQWEFSFQRKSGSISPQKLSRGYYKLESKAVEEEKNYWSTIAKTHEHCNYFALLNPVTPVSKLVLIESPREDELSASNIAPNGGENRRQSTEYGSNEQ